MLFSMEIESIDHIHSYYLKIGEISLRIFDHLCMLKQKKCINDEMITCNVNSEKCIWQVLFAIERHDEDD